MILIRQGIQMGESMIKKIVSVCALCGMLTVVFGAAPSLAQQQDSDYPAREYFLDKPDSKKYVVILSGATANDETKARFRQWSFSLHDTLSRDYGYTKDSITLLLNKGSESTDIDDNSANFRIDGPCRLEDIEKHFAELRDKVEEGDQITIFLIGHGSGDNEESKFNIVGPDITGTAFAEILQGFSNQDIAIINTTSSSYGFSAALAGEGRVLISSTRSNAEKYDPIFPRFFIEALDHRAGDRDKNNRVSMLEAFNYATQSVKIWYEEQGRLAAEHATLDDDGDGLFAIAPGTDQADGALAEIAYIDILSFGEEKTSADALAFKARMQKLERSVFILRGQKTDYLEVDYWLAMEELLVELAQVTGKYDDSQ